MCKNTHRWENHNKNDSNITESHQQNNGQMWKGSDGKKEAYFSSQWLEIRNKLQCLDMNIQQLLHVEWRHFTLENRCLCATVTQTYHMLLLFLIKRIIGI